MYVVDTVESLLRCKATAIVFVMENSSRIPTAIAQAHDVSAPVACRIVFLNYRRDKQNLLVPNVILKYIDQNLKFADCTVHVDVSLFSM